MYKVFLQQVPFYVQCYPLQDKQMISILLAHYKKVI